MRTLHLFQWNLDDVTSNLDEMKKSGWDSILIGPVQPKSDANNKEWWSIYQPASLMVEKPYELEKLCIKAKEIGIKVICDVVFTHFGNDGKMNSLIPASTVDKNLVNNEHFWKEKKLIDYNDRWSVTHHCNGMPATRVDNYDFQDLVVEFLNKLIEVGVDGFRVDSCKMISLPEEDGNNCLPRVYSKLNKPVMWFGEVINEDANLLSMYHKYIGTINNLSDSAYRVDKNKELVFVESHDTFLNGNASGYTKRLSEEQILINYRYLLRDFPNVIYYPRPFSDSWKYANK